MEGLGGSGVGEEGGGEGSSSGSCERGGKVEMRRTGKEGRSLGRKAWDRRRADLAAIDDGEEGLGLGLGFWAFSSERRSGALESIC